MSCYHGSYQGIRSTKWLQPLFWIVFGSNFSIRISKYKIYLAKVWNTVNTGSCYTYHKNTKSTDVQASASHCESRQSPYNVFSTTETTTTTYRRKTPLHPLLYHLSQGILHYRNSHNLAVPLLLYDFFIFCFALGCLLTFLSCRFTQTTYSAPFTNLC